MGGLSAPGRGDEALTEVVRCTAWFEVGGTMPRGSLARSSAHKLHADVGASAPSYSCRVPRLIHDLVQEQVEEEGEEDKEE
eukprot:4181809-Pyramimonas_sp.AAC.1